MIDTTKIEQSFLIELFQYGSILLKQPLSISKFSAQLPELLMEREANGKISIKSPVKRSSGRRESLLNIYVGHWSLENELGEVFSSSTGVELPTDAVKSPDILWVSDERLAAISQDEEHDYLEYVWNLI